MSKRPWMAFYPSDYLGDTKHLSTLEHGAYLLLLCHYWQHGELPPDDDRLARITGLDQKQWSAEVRPVLQAFFYDGWRHKRVEYEIDRSTERAESGRKGGLARVANAQANSKLTTKLTTKLTSSPTATTTTIEEKEVSPPAKGRVTYTEDFDRGFWNPYPRTPNMSKFEAWKEWKKLAPEDRQAAIASVPQFAEWVSKQKDYTTLYADRFLKKRRFDGFQPASNVVDLLSGVLPGFYAPDGSPELEAWDRYWYRTKGVNAPRDRTFGYWFDTQWPPEEDQHAVG